MRKRLGAALAAVVLAGCGSTAQQASPSRSAGGTSTADEFGGASTETTIASDSARISPSQGRTTPRGTQANAGRSQLGPTAKSLASGTTIRLGVVYLKGLEAAYAAVGANNATVDSKAATQAVVDDVNAHGGVAGRKIVPDYYAIDGNSATPRADQLTAACEHYINDHPVDVVASYTGGNLVDCLSKKGIPLVNGYPGANTAASTFTRAPLYAEPAGMTLERLSARLPGFLVDHKWIDARWPATSACAATTQPKLGVVTFDTPEYHAAVDGVLKPAFSHAGHPVVDTAYLVASGNTASQLSSVATGIQNAILRFSSDCIDHVVFVSQVAVDGLFMLSASQQHYTPRYGFSSQEAPLVAISDVPDYQTQMHGSIGMGWVPFEDVDSPDFDATAAAPGRHCLDVLHKAGVVPADNNSTILALPSCESVYFVTTMFGRLLATPGATYASVLNGLGANGYQPSGTYSASFSPSHHDGPNAYRDFAFNDACACFKYTSGTRSL